MFIQPFSMEKDLPEIWCLMEVSAMFCNLHILLFYFVRANWWNAIIWWVVWCVLTNISFSVFLPPLNTSINLILTFHSFILGFLFNFASKMLRGCLNNSNYYALYLLYIYFIYLAGIYYVYFDLFWHLFVYFNILLFIYFNILHLSEHLFYSLWYLNVYLTFYFIYFTFITGS